MPITFASASLFLYVAALLHDKASPGVLCPRGSLRRVGPRHGPALLSSTMAPLMGLVPCPFCWRTDWGGAGPQNPKDKG